MSGDDRDNILLISWDSVRADHLPMYGYDRETTPYLSDVAADGLVFEDTHVSGVGTPTSFTGAFTGEHAHAVQTNIEPEHWQDANGRRRLLSEALQDAGYHTGAVHSNALMSRYYGWHRGWDVYKDNLWTEAGDTEQARKWNELKKTVILPVLRKTGLAGAAIHARNIALRKDSYAPWESMWDDIREFVETAPEPWFLWVLLVDTHHPWHPPEQYQEWVQPGFRQTHAWNYIMRRYPEFTGERKQAIVNAYDNELRHADGFLKRLDGLLAETGNADAPMIVHSDHGDELGEHDDYGHRPAMWDTVTRVPLIMRNVGESGRVDGPHTLKDLGSTVLDLAGSDERLNGRPSLLGDERTDRDRVYIENKTLDGETIAAAVDDRGWKVIDHPDEGLRAFYRPDDPFEQHSMLDDQTADLREWLRQEMQRDRRSIEQQSAAQTQAEAGSDVQERLAELGYIE